MVRLRMCWAAWAMTGMLLLCLLIMLAQGGAEWRTALAVILFTCFGFYSGYYRGWLLGVRDTQHAISHPLSR